MELATIPHHSSAMSTESQQQASASASTAPTAHSLQKHHNKPQKQHSSSDSHIAITTDRPQQTRRHRRTLSSQSSIEVMEEQALKYGASHVIHLFVPVSLCMAVVILTMLTVGYYSEAGQYLPYTPFHGDSTDTSTIFLQSFANAGILLCVIIVMTIILICLYKYRCYKIIHGWLMLSSLMLLSIFTLSYIEELFRNYNIPIDYITVGFFIWNWCVLGMICIHWKGPLLLQQFYLVAVSALMALMFIKHLPEWTVWSILAVLSVWDLVAVLCPKGPLRILVETAQQRNEPIFPALIYSSGVLYIYTIFSILTEPVENLIQTEAGEQQLPSSNIDHNNQTGDIHTNGTECDGSASSRDGLLENRVEITIVEDSNQSATNKGALKEKTTKSNMVRRLAPGRGVPNISEHRNRTTTSGDTLITNIGSASHSQQATPTQSRTHSPPRRIASAQNLPTEEREIIEERGVKLGLGDFIFYSVLVGKASSYGDWNVTIACYVSILVGLAFTLMLLALFRKALPALPISIFAGICFFFATKWLITPFTNAIAIRQLIL